MSDGIDIEFVRETYQKMPDDELIRVATQDAAGLTPEAQEVVKGEIIKRRLDTNIIKGVKAHLRRFVFAKVGQVETYKGNKEKLQEIISGD